MQNSNAEYRAFLLKISQAPEPTPDATTPVNAEPSFRLVKSNFDHLQYGRYYPLQPGETIQYVETWMCRGRTGGMTPVCKSPREIASETAQSPESK